MPVASPALPARSAVGLPCPPSGLPLLSSATAIWAPLKQLHSCLRQHLPSPSSHWTPAEKDQSCSWGPPSQEQRRPGVGGRLDIFPASSHKGLWGLDFVPWAVADRPPCHILQNSRPCASLLPPPGAAPQGFFSVPCPVRVGFLVPLPVVKSPCSPSTGTFLGADSLHRRPQHLPSLPRWRGTYFSSRLKQPLPLTHFPASLARPSHSWGPGPPEAEGAWTGRPRLLLLDTLFPFFP